MTQRIPDASDRVPERADVAWRVDEAGRVRIERRRSGAAGSRVLRALRVRDTLTVRLDPLGSEAWSLLDGRRTTGEVLEVLREAHPDEDDLAARLGAFLGRMVGNGLVRLR